MNTRLAVLFSLLLPAAALTAVEPAVSVVATNGMPRDIVEEGHIWNFGPGSLWTHRGWQYAAYWDETRQVSVARRRLQDGAWEFASLPGYQRTSSGDRGKGGRISRGFGDGHEKVSLGISPDGFIHLAFDHHLSTLRYRKSRLPVAADAAAHRWSHELFGPVRKQLGGEKIDFVTYPRFSATDSEFLLYLRLGGGSGSANSHLFTYEDGKWTTALEPAAKIIDKTTSGADKTVNAYPHNLEKHEGRWHLTWCWRSTPDPKTSRDLCYAFSDDSGHTWRNNGGKIIGIRGKKPITADSPGVTVWDIPPGGRYRNGGSMTVDHKGRVFVLAYGETTGATLYRRDPETGTWTRRERLPLGELVAGQGDDLFIVSQTAIHRLSTASARGKPVRVATFPQAWFKDSKPVVDTRRFAADGVISVIGQEGRTVRVADWQPPQKAR